MATIYRSPIRFLLFDLMCLTSYGVFSQDELPLLLNPAPGVSARIDKQGEDYVLIQPRGQRITLVSQDKLTDLGQGDPIFNEEDYDYDGYADIDYPPRLPADLVKP